MSPSDAVAAILFLGVVAYAVFAGADFGCGIWDLSAGDATSGAPMRSLIDHSIGPVWEANHVWLVFVLVYLWTGFPTAFAAISETLFVPLTLAGFGIVLRGCAFAFRKSAPTVAQARAFGALFASASVITPFFLGAVVGGIASGRVPLDGSGDQVTSWLNPTSVVGGALAVATCAFLAAVFLAADATRHEDTTLQRACRGRALLAAIVTGVVALGGILPLRDDAPFLFDRLTGRGLALMVAASVAGALTVVALWRERPLIARATAVTAVVLVVAGWGIAQYPWILVGAATIDDAAGNRSTLWALIAVFGVAGVTVVPSLGYLYLLTQREKSSVQAVS